MKRPPESAWRLSACLASSAGVGAQRPEQHRGAEADPLGHRRGGGERDQRLVVVVDDAVDRPQAGEAARRRPAAPTRSAAAPLVPGTAFGSPIADVHPASSFAICSARLTLANGYRRPAASAGRPESLSRRWERRRAGGRAGEPCRARGGTRRLRGRRLGHERADSRTRRDGPDRKGAGRTRARTGPQPRGRAGRGQARPPPSPRHPGGAGRIRCPHLHGRTRLGRSVRRGQSDANPTVVRTIKAGQTAKIKAGQWIVEQPSDIHRAANTATKPVTIYIATLLEAGAPPATPVP